VHVLARILLKVSARDAKALHTLWSVDLQEAAAADRDVVLAASIDVTVSSMAAMVVSGDTGISSMDCAG
jgi:hypothetical protein